MPENPYHSAASPSRPPRSRRHSRSKARMYTEWLALRCMVAILRRGSLKQAAAIARGCATLGYFLLPDLRRWALKNLELVFGDSLSTSQRKALARIAFGNIALSYIEGFRAEEITITIENENIFWEAYAKRKGVLLCGVHLGSWEAGVYVPGSRGLPTVGVYRPEFNPLADQEILRARSQAKAEWIPITHSARIIQALRQAKILLLMTDLNYPVGGVMADFLGVPASCPAGPAKMALRYGTPIIPVVAIRTAVGQATAHVLSPVETEDVNEKDGVVTLTERLNRAFEPWIINYAEQYYWSYPRWRIRPNGRHWTIDQPVEEVSAERTDPPHEVPPRIMQLLRR